MTKAYVIAHPKVTDMEKFGSDFASKVDATLVPFEGKFLVRTPDVLHQEGEKGNFTVIIEFPDKYSGFALKEFQVFGQRPRDIPVFANGTIAGAGDDQAQHQTATGALIAGSGS